MLYRFVNGQQDDCNQEDDRYFIKPAIPHVGTFVAIKYKIIQ